MKNDKIFRKIVQIVKNDNLEVTHNSTLILIGSCFSNEIGKRLKYTGFSTFQPFGTIFNPITIADNLLRILNKKYFTDEDLVKVNNVFFSWSHSSKNYHNINSAELMFDLNNEIDTLNYSFTKNTILLLTFGTSIVYELNNQVVGNCHKQPQNYFKKRRLSVEEVVLRWKDVINKCKNQTFIFTVSPVRHYKDGTIENSRSKAVLILAIDKLLKLYPNQVFYFPSYEIVMDELRDYRFYNSDMIHPNNDSVDYIWEKFQETYFNTKTIDIVNSCEKIRKSLNHKPFFNDGVEYQSFAKKLKNKIDLISIETPLYDWSKELNELDKELLP